MKLRHVLSLLLSLAICAYVFTEPAAGPRIRFELAIAHKNKSGEIKPIDPSAAVNALGQDEQIQIYIRPVCKVFIYLFDLDSDGDLELLFPQSFDMFAKTAKSGIYGDGKGFYIPEKQSWLEFDRSGTDGLILLASSKRLTRLESLIDDYISSQKKSADEASEAKQDLLDEIRRLRKENSIFAGAVEKPVVIAGDYRGNEQTIESFIVDIEAEGFYAKTIRIEH
jgi:hypothetical protein